MPIGLKIKLQRESHKLSQMELATRCGISHSYVNLIEHGNRNPPPYLISKIAHALNCSEAILLNDFHAIERIELQAILSKAKLKSLSSHELIELAAKHPKIIELLIAQDSKIESAKTKITSLSNTLSHNPKLDETIHTLLSHIAAIRSTASLLTQSNIESQNTKERFMDNIHKDSLQLSKAITELMNILSIPIEQHHDIILENEANSIQTFTSRHNSVFHELDTLAETQSNLTPIKTDELLNKYMTQSLKLTDTHPNSHIKKHLSQYFSDAQIMPLQSFSDTAETVKYNPIKLSKIYKTDIHSVMRRLACLYRPGINAPDFALLIINSLGQYIYQHESHQISLPHQMLECAAWPVVKCLHNPHHPTGHSVKTLKQPKLLSYNIATIYNYHPNTHEPIIHGAMLLCTPENSAKVNFDIHNQPPIPIGISCQSCPHKTCFDRVNV